MLEQDQELAYRNSLTEDELDAYQSSENDMLALEQMVILLNTERLDSDDKFLLGNLVDHFKDWDFSDLDFFPMEKFEKIKKGL